MSIVLKKRISGDGTRYWYTFESGRGKSERIATGIFTYIKPKSNIERAHNKAALQQLELKQAELILSGTKLWQVPNHRTKNGFLAYYKDFVERNKRRGNRHLEGSYSKLKAFVETKDPL